MTSSSLMIWGARALHIAGILFISMFALDVLGADAPVTRIILGLLVHLIPSFVLLGLFVLAWFFPAIGGAILVIAGLSPLVLLSNPVWVNLTLGGPFIVAGLLYLGGWWLGRSSAPR